MASTALSLWLLLGPFASDLAPAWRHLPDSEAGQAAEDTHRQSFSECYWDDVVPKLCESEHTAARGVHRTPVEAAKDEEVHSWLGSLSEQLLAAGASVRAALGDAGLARSILCEVGEFGAEAVGAIFILVFLGRRHARA
mmetsp:Transcript_116108/g.339472  ORF Transcript_116108/g.339472 Transcript_116108/m.339472 type:complete len:139 (+) Transcript_116108:81-497(+)